MDNGIKCPNIECTEQFLFDWCQDDYKTVSGISCKQKTLLETTEQEITMLSCPSCNCILGFYSLVEGCFFNHESWSNIDWEEYAVREPKINYDRELIYLRD